MLYFMSNRDISSKHYPLPTLPMSHFARSTLIVAIFFGMEKVLGFLRQIFIARQFGLSAELDAFNAANNLPDLLFALISGGALAMALIPVLSQYLQEKGHKAAWELFSRIANLVFLATASLSVIIGLLSEQIVGWRLGIAPGFSQTQQTLVAELMRLNLVATLLFSMGGLVIAGLQANQHFILPALAPSMYDLGSFFGILVLSPSEPYRFGMLTLPAFGLGVHGLTYGVILGAALFLIIQLPGLLRYRFRWTPAINLHHPGVQQVLRLMAPRILTVFFVQLVFISQDNIASRLVAGSVTALVYGWLFMQVPETLIGTALGTVLLPTLSEHAARREDDAFRQTYLRAMRAILALTIPLALLIAITIRPVVAILGFDADGSEMVTWTVRAYMLGLIGHSILEVSARGFYARQDARTPLLAGGLAAITFILLALFLSPWLGAAGIGLANSLAYTGQALLLWILLHRRFGGLFDIFSTLRRSIPAAAVGTLIAWLVLQLPLPPLPLAAIAVALGLLVCLPFIWQEIKGLIK